MTTVVASAEQCLAFNSVFNQPDSTLLFHAGASGTVREEKFLSFVDGDS